MEPLGASDIDGKTERSNVREHMSQSWEANEFQTKRDEDQAENEGLANCAPGCCTIL